MQRVPEAYAITRADAEDIADLVAINVDSDRLFAGTGLISEADLGEHVPEAVFRDAIAMREVFVMRHGKAGEPVGFTLTSQRGGTLYLDQISVAVDHARKGLGTALMKRVLDDARDRGFRFVTLSTFREVPWNAPFYRSLGFREVADKSKTDWMRDLEAAQSASLDISKRCFMQKRVRLF